MDYHVKQKPFLTCVLFPISVGEISDLQELLKVPDEHISLVCFWGDITWMGHEIEGISW